MGRRNTNRIILEDLEIIDAGAKGKSIAKAEDGRVVFVNNAVPGDIATIQTTKKRKAYFEGTAISFSKFSDKRVNQPVLISGLAVAVNGNLWATIISYSINRKK